MQTTDQILMIRPVHFGYNAQTAVNNSFQVNTGQDIHEEALQEYSNMVKLLLDNGIAVHDIPDTEMPLTPDSIFPNNWISFHEDGSICLYPMFAENRRNEKKEHVLKYLRDKFYISHIHDLGYFEKDGLFLEGTGSMVLDRENRIAYTAISPRTSKIVLDEFCRLTGYTAVAFHTADINGIPIYHTNVIMSVADHYAVLCTELIPETDERKKLVASLLQTGKEIIEISTDQVNCFAGNMLQVKNKQEELILVMSERACRSLEDDQLGKLEKYNRILQVSLHHIEIAGGGSARCMMAEIFCTKR